MIRLDLKQILILAALVSLIVSVFIAPAIQKTLDTPETCAGCHEMEKYVATYLRPMNGSIMAQHDLDCLGCHASTSRQRAREAVHREMGVSALNKMTGLDFNTTSPELEVNCSKCHVIKGYSHLNFTATAGCSECHWAHEPTSGILNPYAIPSGPHRNQTCSNCHGKDFKIPRCMNCHSGHGSQELDNVLCLECHIDPHLPIIPGIVPENTVNFSADLPYSLCVPCHENQLDEMNRSNSRHLDMRTCTLCHDSHGKKPRCSKCHSKNNNHDHTILVCKDCHGKIRPLYCPLCHGKSHEWSSLTALHPDELN